jgi:hypothetical protein
LQLRLSRSDYLRVTKLPYPCPRILRTCKSSRHQLFSYDMAIVPPYQEPERQLQRSLPEGTREQVQSCEPSSPTTRSRQSQAISSSFRLSSFILQPETRPLSSDAPQLGSVARRCRLGLDLIWKFYFWTSHQITVPR